MNSNPKKKLLFSEICEGNFSRRAQLEFERMQHLFAKTNQKVTLCMKIMLYPTSAKKGYPEQFKEIDYEVIPATVKHKSERYVVEVSNDGTIVGDGKTISDALQEELRFDEDAASNILSLKEVNNE